MTNCFEFGYDAYHWVDSGNDWIDSVTGSELRSVVAGDGPVDVSDSPAQNPASDTDNTP